MPDLRAPGTPSALHPPPPRVSTPLPATFSLRPDESLHEIDGGTVLLGGSPLRLFRLSERARHLVGRWRDGVPVGPGAGAGLLARRLVTAGAMSPRVPRGGALGPADVTVVVPVRDRHRQLDRLLGALAPLAVVVVDDASAAPGATKEIADRHGARFVGLPVNVGPAAARNAGMAAAHGALVAFVDSDCVPGDDWLSPLLGHFDDPVVAAVAPRIAPVGGRAPSAFGRAAAFRRYEATRSSLDRGTRPGPVRPAGPIPFVPSAALVVRADVATGPDLFDPALRGGEDVDFVWRLVDAGWDVRYEPASTVAHDAAATFAGYLRRQAFYGTTAADLSLRHPGALAPLRISAWTLAAWVLVLARRPVLAVGAIAAPVLILAHRLRGLVRDPVAVATRIVGGGTLRGAPPSLAGLARAWSPALLAGLAFRRSRRACALALTLASLSDWSAHRDALDPVRYSALHVADDAAYGAGVWVGCARRRTLGPILPRVSWRAPAWSSDSLRRAERPGPQGPGAPPSEPGAKVAV